MPKLKNGRRIPLNAYPRHEEIIREPHAGDKFIYYSDYNSKSKRYNESTATCHDVIHVFDAQNRPRFDHVHAFHVMCAASTLAHGTMTA